jgi:hypothetical protein
MIKNKMLIKDLKYYSISKEHNQIISNFNTYESELKKFLVENALDHQNRNISKTYLFFL